MADKIPLYLSIDSIKGGGTEKDHKDWIPILAFAVTITPPRSSDSKVTDYKVDSVQRINFAAPSDVSFSRLMRSASGGELFDSATLDQVTHPQRDATLLKLGGVVVVECQAKGGGFYFTLVAKSIEHDAAYLKPKRLDQLSSELTFWHGG